jgi:formylglycine-generating enzyme required for sulfatase activity
MKTASHLKAGLFASLLLVAIVGCGKPKSEVQSLENALPPDFTMPLTLPPGARLLELVRLPGNDTIQPFLIGKYEVTQAQYESVMGNNPSAFKSGPDYPVETVNWTEANAFCQKLTAALTEPLEGKAAFRLPTDAEWSLAAGLSREDGRTPKEKDFGVKDAYPWGMQWPPPSGAGNYYDAAARQKHSEGDFIEAYNDGYPDTSPAGVFKPNEFGLYDLGGNVWEWCEDGYDDKGDTRVLRGASWRTGERDRLLSSRRLDGPPEARGAYVGFRVVLASPAPSPHTDTPR